MENVIKIETEHVGGAFTTKIEIDNSTEYKDFNIELTHQGEKPHAAGITINKEAKSISFGNTTLFGLESQLFIEFINQLKA